MKEQIQRIKARFDAMIFPYFFARVNCSRGERHGEVQCQKDHRKAKMPKEEQEGTVTTPSCSDGKLYSPREESFPIPLKYIDVSRTTQTNLDVMQERRIDDYWNIDGSRDLSDSWTGFTQFIPSEEKPPEGFLWSGRRLTRKQLTSRPDHLWPELWTKLGRNAQLKERQKWSDEKTEAR